MKDCAELEAYVSGIAAEEVARRLGAERIIKLSSNENPYGASPKAVEAFRSFSELHRYPDPEYAELREKIAEYTGWEFERIVVGAGIDGILETVFRFAVGEGDEVLIAPPTFSYYRILARLSCARIVEAKRNDRFEVEGAAELVSRKTKLAIFCSPNNPTGNLERDEEIVSVAESIKGLVFVDEAYVEFAEKCFGKDLDNVIIARTFSKAFGLANLRIGYARLPEELVGVYRAASTPFPVSTAAAKAAIAALEDIEWLQSCVERIRSERERLYSFLSRRFEAYPSQANFVLFKAPQNLYEELLRRGIIVRECSSFGLGGYVRVSVGRKEENDAFMEAIEEIA